MRTHLIHRLTGARPPPEKTPSYRLNGVPFDTWEAMISAARSTVGPKVVEVSGGTIPPGGVWDCTGLVFQAMR